MARILGHVTSITPGKTSGVPKPPPTPLDPHSEKARQMRVHKALEKVRQWSFHYNASLKWYLVDIKRGQQILVDTIKTIQHLEGADPRIQQIVTAWETRPVGSDIDAICEVCQVPQAVVFGWFAEAAFRLGVNFARMTIGLALGEAVHASLIRAADPVEGHDERKMLFQIMGLLPTGGVPAPRRSAKAEEADEPDGPVEDDQTFEQNSRDVADVIRGTS